jgi:hypothetical protein
VVVIVVVVGVGVVVVFCQYCGWCCMTEGRRGEREKAKEKFKNMVSCFANRTEACIVGGKGGGRGDGERRGLSNECVHVSAFVGVRYCK